MDEYNFESAKNTLISEFKDAPYVRDAPFGHPMTEKKIHALITAFVTNGKTRTECKDWLIDLFKKNHVEKKYNDYVDGIIDAYYHIKEYQTNLF